MMEDMYVLSLSADAGLTYRVTHRAVSKQPIQTEVSRLRTLTRTSEVPFLRWKVDLDGQPVEEFTCPSVGGILNAM